MVVVVGRNGLGRQVPPCRESCLVYYTYMSVLYEWQDSSVVECLTKD